ncbi:MAG: 23S rRNA (guanosine(2251)-2'-O)-methyltransferase RlmB [Chlamydiia bacterium]|nr:23S rRNA (guanosine(2251)-2'-O)-methyltransferase RlmB [Chlamydiia bacterium]
MRMIMGKHAIEVVVKQNPERIVQIYSHKKDYPFPVTVVSKQKLASMVGSESHQGLVAEVKEREFLTPKEFLKKAPEKSLVLMVDSINDPQNFGAILRAAECFGVDAVIYSKNRNVGLTPAVSKASVGASEIVPLMPVSNLFDTLKKFQEEGYFAVAAEAKEKSQMLSTFEFPQQTLLIMGAEGSGIQPLLSKHSDFHVMIPMQGMIDSLNVSQATAVLLNQYGLK